MDIPKHTHYIQQALTQVEVKENSSPIHKPEYYVTV